MARYDHLPIYRTAFDLAVHMERVVRNFSRYHKYTLGTELRNCSRGILKMIIEANGSREREALLLQLREELEWLKVLSRLCHESACFSGVKAYIHICEQIIDISKQNEGWIKQTKKVFGEGGAWSEPKRRLGFFGRTRFIIVRPSRLPAGQALYHRLSVPFLKDRLPGVPVYVYMPGEVYG